MLKIIAKPENLYVPVFRDLIARKINNPIVLLSGGRGSAKSTSAAQYIFRKSLKEKQRTGLVRKYFKYIRESQHQDLVTFSERLKIDSSIKTTYSPLGFRFPNGSEIISLGLDKQKVKSLSGVKTVWVEELTELTQDDWLTLVLTVLRGGGNPQIIANYNPTFGSWINDYFFYADGTLKSKDVYHLHTTYKDNPFVGQTFARMIESLSDDLYSVHGLGLPGKLEGLIFPEYSVIDEFPADVPFVYGGDKGFNDPFAFVKVGYKDGNLYADEVFYEKYRLTLNVIDSLKEEQKQKPWRIDDSAADTIAELKLAGFNADKANKGRINDGILQMKKCKIFITKSSVNLLREMGGYVWLKDSRGITHDEPAPNLSDHAVDAFRYGAIYFLRPKISSSHGGKF